MKTFKHFIQKRENPFLNWRHSSFAEVFRNTENIKESEESILKATGLYHPNTSYDQIHEHEGLKPKQPFSKEQRWAIEEYTGSSPYFGSGAQCSKNINEHARHKMGNFDSKIVGDHKPEEVEKAHHQLMSIYTPDHTNSQAIETFSGIPKHVSEKLSQMKNRTTTHLPGFTSTSTNRSVAEGASKTLHENPENHLIKFHIEPGAGVSLVKHSTHPSEDEVLIGAGTKVTKLKTETDEHGNVTHHFIAHNDRLPLDQYPHEYKHDR